VSLLVLGLLFFSLTVGISNLFQFARVVEPAVVFHSKGTTAASTVPPSSFGGDDDDDDENNGNSNFAGSSSTRRMSSSSSVTGGNEEQQQSPPPPAAGDEEKRGCRILVQNSFPFHYEVLESAMHFPFEYFNLKDDDESNAAAKACFPSSSLSSSHGRNGTNNATTVTVYFDFALKGAPLGKDTSDWIGYFQETIRPNYNNGTLQHLAVRGSGAAAASDADSNIIRKVGGIVPYIFDTKSQARDGKYAAVIEASCFCKGEGERFGVEVNFHEWINAFPSKRRCVLHRYCPRTHNNPNFLSFSPFNPRFMLPNAYPSFSTNASSKRLLAAHHQQQQQRRRQAGKDEAETEALSAKPKKRASSFFLSQLRWLNWFGLNYKNRDKNKEPGGYKVCVLGAAMRRNYGFVKSFLDETVGKQQQQPASDHSSNNRNTNSSLPEFHVQIYGGFLFPPELEPYRYAQKKDGSNNNEDGTNIVRWEPRINKFHVFQELVATTCDVVLALVDENTHPEYFFDQLTGTVPQASAYNIPLVIHEELVSIYKQHLPDLYETHTASPLTFRNAVRRILGRIDVQEKTLRSEMAALTQPYNSTREPL